MLQTIPVTVLCCIRNTGENHEVLRVSISVFPQMTRGRRSSISSHATFVTLSRALCSNGILALFGISKLPTMSESSPSFPNNRQREEMIERFKIPRNASMLGGGQIWAFSHSYSYWVLLFSVFHGIPLLSKTLIVSVMLHYFL